MLLHYITIMITIPQNSLKNKNRRTTINTVAEKPTFTTTSTPSNVDRDSRFKDIIRKQLGEQGLTITTNLSFIYIIVLLILLLLFSGFLNTVKVQKNKKQVSFTVVR
uniref:GrBNV_gp59-like protein n=1 Tax=Nilaparvata lugens endogenous nudivirus TaxID=1487700 RepID=X5GE48_9VIRU|nr:GrBNV_gp59-like protein [Nilaparvata lugens endogenous nudivirus]